MNLFIVQNSLKSFVLLFESIYIPERVCISLLKHIEVVVKQLVLLSQFFVL
jgi:hypothetical protein